MKQKHTKYTQINTNKSTHSEMDPPVCFTNTLYSGHRKDKECNLTAMNRAVARIPK